MMSFMGWSRAVSVNEPTGKKERCAAPRTDNGSEDGGYCASRSGRARSGRL